MADDLYKTVVRSLGVSIFLIELAMAGSVLLLVFTLQDSLRILSILGLWDKELGQNLWYVWPIVGLNVAAVAWSAFHFIPRARSLFEDSDCPVDKFGTSSDDEARALTDVRLTLNKFSIFMVGLSIAIGMFIGFGFLNVVLVGLLIWLQFAILLFFRELARLLKADEALLT